MRRVGNKFLFIDKAILICVSKIIISSGEIATSQLKSSIMWRLHSADYGSLLISDSAKTQQVSGSSHVRSYKIPMD